MKNETFIGTWIRCFLRDHLIGELNLSKNTQASYRDVFILLLPFIAKNLTKSIDRILVDDISADQIRLFLSHLENERNCSIATRNQRLAAIHALARFIGGRSPEHLVWCNEVRFVPFKKAPKPSVSYLEKVEIDAILDTPDLKSRQGLRDYALLLFLYNTGARADEVAKIKIGDLNLGNSPSAKIVGKGNKTRHCPLWAVTIGTLNSQIQGRGQSEQVFLNRRKQPITRFGIHTLVKRYSQSAAKKVSSLGIKKIGPHTIRHTTAVHLLRAGVDINTIRAWLGHVSLDTTHIYAEVDLEMKAKALAHCEVLTPMNQKTENKKGQELMAFLTTL